MCLNVCQHFSITAQEQIMLGKRTDRNAKQFSKNEAQQSRMWNTRKFLRNNASRWRKQLQEIANKAREVRRGFTDYHSLELNNRIDVLSTPHKLSRIATRAASMDIGETSVCQIGVLSNSVCLALTPSGTSPNGIANSCDRNTENHEGMSHQFVPQSLHRFQTCVVTRQLVIWLRNSTSMYASIPATSLGSSGWTDGAPQSRTRN